MNVSFLEIARSFFEIPDDFSLPEKSSSSISIWQKRLSEQFNNAKYGYPKTEIFRIPTLEDDLIEILAPILGIKRKIETNATLCLTHDLDYLKSTTQMNIKRSFSQKMPNWKYENYFTSIQTLVEYDISQGGSSSFFVACPQKIRPGLRRMKQWILDPSYNLHDALFQEVLSIFNKKNVEIGIHGSFYSHEENLLSEEVIKLSKATGRQIRCARQHWLNLPDPSNDFARIAGAGIKVDSTMGWNGTVGFRGGISRPFKIQTANGPLALLPMVLMDGPLFDDLRLSPSEAVKLSIQILEEVHQRQGTVALDWHERCAHPSYEWFDAYCEIVSWAKNKGFQFSSVTGSVG